jgi:hypothetical protein
MTNKQTWFSKAPNYIVLFESYMPKLSTIKVLLVDESS